MINKMISNITIDDIQSLIDNSVCESKLLEYKKELKIESDSDKKEFLADISSFANCIGGDIIFGIEEDEENNPKSIVGILYENEDKLIRRLEDFIRQSIQPVIIDIEYNVIDLGNKTCVLIIRVPQSIVSPHRVEYKGTNKFFTRNNKGKYQMDVSELRSAFNSGLDLNKRIENYKNDTYFELIANKYGKLQDDLPIFVLHYIPLSAFSNSNPNNFSLSNIKEQMNNASSKTLTGSTYDKKITIDGVVIEYKSQSLSSTAKYKTNGIIEKTTTDFFKKDYINTSIRPPKKCNVIQGGRIIECLIDDYKEVKRYFDKMNINGPFVISCSILNGAEYTIPVRDWFDILNVIDRDILYLDNIFIDNFEESAESVLMPIFNSLWNACGYERCRAYDSEGNYIGMKYFEFY